MYEKPFIAQLNLSTTAATEIYRVPVDSTTTFSSGTSQAQAKFINSSISSIVICETAGGAATATIYIQPIVDATTVVASEKLVSALALSANETKIISPGLILPGDPNTATPAGIVVQANSGTLTFQVFGIEIGG